MDINKDIEKVLVSEEELDEIITRMGAEISRDYEGRRLMLLCILKGSVVFMGDLMKKMKIPVEIDFMRVSSYGNSTKSLGAVNIILDLHRTDLDDIDILIVEDIIDSGKTLAYLTGYLMNKGARSVKIATLLDKPERRDPRIELKADYVGKVIPDEFVVGYGLDFAERYRALPYVGVLKPSVYGEN